MRIIIVAVPIAPALFADEKVDLYTINRIKAEAFQNSKVMENAFYLTDVYGPRLTTSPGDPGRRRVGRPRVATGNGVSLSPAGAPVSRNVPDARPTRLP